MLYLSLPSPITTLSPAIADDSDSLYLIEGIEATSTHTNPVIAKQSAFRDAQERAFQTLLDRVTSRLTSSAMPTLQENTIENLIRDITFVEEKIGANFYYAKLDIRFQKSRVETYLNEQGILLTVAQQTRVLVLPLYQEAGITRLWERNNLWLNAWEKQNNLTLSGLKIITPEGSLQDRNILQHSDVLQLNEKKMQKLAQQYDTENYMISFAKMSPDIGQNKVKLSFQTLSFIKGVSHDTYKFTETRSSISEILNAMEHATQNIIEHTSLAVAKRSINTVSSLTGGGEQRVYIISASIKGLGEFVEIEKTLKEIPEFSDIKAQRANKYKAMWSIVSPHPSAQIVVILKSYALDARSDPLRPHIIALN